MFDVLAKFKKSSEEYNELMYRIMCGQHYQQCSIDKIKGIKSKPMPKEWYDIESNKIHEGDSEDIIKQKAFNLSILANKKPYFFIYIYPQLKILYTQFLKEINDKCLSEFEMTYNELVNLKEKTELQENFIKYGELKSPVTNNQCTMNRICHSFEKEFKNIKTKLKTKKFNPSILKTDKEYSKNLYKKINKIYSQYCDDVKQYKIKTKEERIDKNTRNSDMLIMKSNFKEKCEVLCDKETLCNILVDLCYKNNKSKQFVWDIVGEQIFNNLLVKNDNFIEYPIEDENGDIDFKGYKFSMRRFKV